jgi:beta-1,4-mannosyltransferase
VTDMRDVRIASRPGPENENPYFRLMYGALEREGVHYAGPFQVNDGWLRSHASEFDALHLHWPEWLWRPRGRSSPRMIVGLNRYLALARRLGLLRVWTVHNLPPHEWQAADAAGLWLIAREIDLFVCHSRESERRTRQWLRPRASAHTIVMPHGNYDGAYPPPSPGADPRAEFGLPRDKPLIGLVGQLRRYKGIETALDAIAKLGDRAHLVIAGRPVGDVRWLLQRAAGMSSRVTLIDRALSDQELADLLSVLDLYWLPYARITGSGALLLALTAGIAVAASDIPFFRELLEGSPAAGRLATPGDAASLADVTEALFAVRRDDRRAAARAIADSYSWLACTRLLADAIRGSLAERHAFHAEYA